MAQGSMRRWARGPGAEDDAGFPLDARRDAPREIVASYGDYAAAQEAVDHLSDRGFPVARVSIVAEGLRLVEDVTGRMGYGRAIWGGAAWGALTGAVIGFLFGLLTWLQPVASGLTLALYGLVLGAVVGAAVAAVGHWLSGGRRDFSSVERLTARRYNLVVDRDVAEQAHGLLGHMPPRSG